MNMNIFNKIIPGDLLWKAPWDKKATLDEKAPLDEKDKNMTFAVKANIACGYEASASTPSLRGWVPKGFSPVVRRLLDSGHQIAGITNMHELAFGITSEYNPQNTLKNTPACIDKDINNPYKAGYIPGGSSGGSAAAVAMNAVSFALGTDTGGSMRIPASLCGVVGYRPTTGLYPVTAVCPLSSTTDTIGIFAHQVTTVQLAHKAIEPSYSCEVRSLSGVRIGVPRQFYYSVLDSEVSRITELALKTLREAGVELVECDIKLTSDFSVLVKSFLDLIIYETGDLVPKYLKEQDAPVSFEELCKRINNKVVKEIFTVANQIPEEQYLKSQRDVQEIRGSFDEYFTSNNLEGFVVPTTILPAIKRPTPENVTVCGQEFNTLQAYVHNSMLQAIAGVPCISIPSGVSADGLPIGLELVAPQGQDSNMLNLAAAIQAVLPALPKLSSDDFKGKLLECTP